MKHFRKFSLSLLLTGAMLLCLVQTSFADGISVSAGQGSVSEGKTVAFSITVPSGSEAWTYSVSWSGNLTLESGDTAPMGFEGDNRTNQLVFRANSTGTGTVSISAGSYCIAGVDYDASGSASVTIVAADKPDDSEPAPAPTPSGGGDSSTGNNPGVSLSSNNALSSLTVSAGTLTPAFDPAITEYTLSLPSQSDRLTITANPSDSRATVQGDGEISLQDGETSLSVVVTAEDGSAKAYTITVQVAQAPTLFLDYNGQRLGVVKDVSQVTPPAGFAPANPITYSGDTQRVMIAMALACEPDILIADEPTTALDVTIQAQILELMQSLQKKLGMAIIMVTHDLGVIADMCDEIIVMYGGRVCERGTAEDIFYRPHHEYTKGLLRSIPNVDRIGEKLIPIPGTPINLLNMPKGCAFCPRCEEAMKICIEEQPPEMQMPDGHFASCWLNVKAAMEEEKGGRQ